ncbi:hypothetical protein MKW92_041472 [Papaver armeniacum]|nr:hypothetical protein MKW92_041472 [Papaver armeniacum]
MGIRKIPYSGRIHLNFLPKDLERKYGEFSFNYVKKTLKGKILPQTHWKSVRVRVIANDIIEALKRGLGDKGVQESSGEAKKGSKVATYLLEGLDWETLVVDEPIINAFCYPGGKILVYTGLLDYLRSDAEVASVLAHEVGHAVARHGPEYISNTLCFEFLKIILNTLFRSTGDTTSLDEACKYLLVDLPFSRRIEKEADYIGLLLLASAGYDPRVAIQVCEKFGMLEDGGSFLGDCLATHPSEKKRAQLLSQDKVMGEALGIYREPNFNRCFERRFSYCCSFWESAFLLCFTVLFCVLLRKKTQIDP